MFAATLRRTTSMGTPRRNLSVAVALVCSAVAGLLAALFLVGPNVLDPRNTDWLLEDPATHYLGWAFFRQTPTWFLPLTWTDRLGYPWGVSISFFDSIPLLAILLRPLSGAIGEPFQYLGLYTVLCLTLQAFFGFKLARYAGLPTSLSAGLGAAFFLLAPALVWRFHAHFALASHWLILAALVSYLRELPDTRTFRWLLPLWVILTVAGGINPYIGAMCLLIVLAGVARLWLESRVSLAGLLGLGMLSTAVLVLSLTTFGFLIGGRTESYSGWGYRYYSLNLLAPIDPHVYGGLLYGALPQATEGQYEGYNYLGLGLIVLLLGGLLVRSLRLRSLLAPSMLPLVGVAVVSTCAAASATVAIGPYTILELPLPWRIESIAGMLRASGRLFWPAYYLLVLAALASLRSVRPPLRATLLGIALFVQLADLMPLMEHVRAVHDRRREANLVDPIWNRLGERHAHLVIHPAWQCDYTVTPGGWPSYATFGLLAASQGMTLNSYYSGRIGPQDIERHCHEALVPFLAGDLDPAAAYVVGDELLGELEPARITTHRCARVDGFNLCLHDPENPGVDRMTGDTVGEPSDLAVEG
jgi:hypothetical protein